MLEGESPLKQLFDKFDVEHLDWGLSDYKRYALSVPPEQNGQLLIRDWTWRAAHFQNIVASINGAQGTGKTLPFLYASMVTGNIYGVPFTVNNLFWDLDELQQSIEKIPPRSTLLKDEHRHGGSGYMAHKEAAHMADLEEQLREPRQINLFFTSVFQENHATFFRFEAHNIDFDLKTGKPKGFFSMLLTPRYTDLSTFVWRGYVYFPMPPDRIVSIYREKKADAQKNLISQYSSTLNALIPIADKIINKRLKDLIKTTKKGFIVPIPAALMLVVVNEEIGSSRFTIPIYKDLLVILKDKIEKHFVLENTETEQTVNIEKEKKDAEQAELNAKIETEKNTQREKRFSLMKEKLIEMKLRREQKEKEIALRTAELEAAKNPQYRTREIVRQNQEKALKEANV